MNGMFFSNQKVKRDLMRKLIAKARPAVCGSTESEVIVPTHKVPAAIKAIKQSGRIYVGKGPAGEGKTKVWFALTNI